MNRVKYAHTAFEGLKCFDIIPHEELLRRYNSVEQIHIDNNENSAGSFRGPTNTELDPSYIGKPLKPLVHFIERIQVGDVTNCKADTTSMDMKGLGKYYDSWLYLTIPQEYIQKYQKRVLGNLSEKHVKIFINFIKEVYDNKLTDKEIIELKNTYDNLYPETYPLEHKRPERYAKRPAWRFDLEVSMVHSVIREGIMFPICFNSIQHIMKRGSHRALIFAHTGNDVPIFVQYNNIPKVKTKLNFEIYPHFDGKSHYLDVDLDNKTMKFIT